MLAIGVLTLVVKLVAFGKDLFVAGWFGTADAMDAFIIAFMVPSLVPMVFAQGLPDALVPARLCVRERDGLAAADRLSVNAVWMYAAALGVVMLSLGVFADSLIPALASGFSQEKQALTKRLFLELLPFGFCYGLSFVLGAWLQAEKRFVLAAAGPAVIPATTLAMLIFAGPALGIHALTLGAVAGALILVVMLVAGVAKTTHHSLLRPGGFSGESVRLARESLPLLAGGLLMSGLPAVDQMMAGWLEAGSVAVMSYSEKLCSLVLSLAAISTSQALFPWLAEQAARRDWAGLRSSTIKYAGIIGAASLPVVAILWFGAPLLVQWLLERGAFSGGDTRRVAAVLQWHAVQIPFFIAAVLASKVILSLRAGKFMLVTTVVNLAANIVLNLVLMRRMGAAGIALATAGVYFTSALMLYIYIFTAVKKRIAMDAAPV